jgi:ribonuclease E
MSSKKKQMVINYVPGEECRVAIVEAGRLEEFHAERMDGPSNHVGNIYVGKVLNVEQAIQAAFIDFGLEQNGFLHTSDVHPQYFPGQDNEKTERVGRKTPRRERPPIQDCFRRGDEVAVQVLKEGVGTKGPTVTSYLSIPGRFLVMMPQMDKVGMSRKVEDEETRRKMREILDQLDLPDGFGFILRTAGMERSKAELKRDLAYLMRLWKDMEKRWKSGSKPRLLYSESDLLVRALRDFLTTEIDEVVVDNEAALTRAARFLKIVAPRTSTRLVHYTGKSPVFHVMGIEPQIQMIHAREVPLESGGRLVIDEAEALVAIDVNSGKSREARDSETNAYQTNCEAVDEICRQLRLRDLGGVIVNDLIDMRSAKHRRDIEARFADNLKKDRARWTIAPISEFGILEMTRQRMRASHESQHFADCPTCRGRGLVQRPDSVAADAMRELAALLDAPSVHRVELVVHPRIAGELLSAKRRALGRIERTSGKHVDVRVSEAILVDRVTFYAYDERGADLDIARIGHRRATEAELVAYEITSDAGDAWTDEPEPIAPEPEPYADEVAADVEAHPIELEPMSLAEIAAQDQARRAQGPHSQQPVGAPGEMGDEGQRRGRRRRGRRGRGRGADGAGQPPMERGFDTPGGPGFAEPGAEGFAPADQQQPYPQEDAFAGVEGQYQDQPGPEGGFEQPPMDGSLNGAPMSGPGGEFGEGGQPGQGGRRRRRRRRGRGGRGGPDQGQMGQPGFAPADGEFAPPVEGGFEGQPPMGDAGMPDAGVPGDSYGHPGGGDQGYEEQGYGAPVEGGEQPGFGPAQGGPPGPDGPGGPRRRRRRRGRRGGGQGGGAPAQGGDGSFAQPQQSSQQPQRPQGGPPQGQPHGQRGGGRPGQPETPSLAAMFRETAPLPLNEGPSDGSGFAPDQGDAPQGGFDGGEEFNVPDSGDGSRPPAPGFNGEPGVEGGPRPRRRRGRRGGRGRAGPEGIGGGGEPQGERPMPPALPARPASVPPAPRSAPPIVPVSQPASGGSPKIRTLYGSRKRIAPVDIKGIKREE